MKLNFGLKLSVDLSLDGFNRWNIIMEQRDEECPMSEIKAKFSIKKKSFEFLKDFNGYNFFFLIRVSELIFNN